MKKDIRVYLIDIQDSILKIEEYAEGMTQADFFENSEKQDAVMRRLGIIGEAVKNISDEFRKQHSDIPWQDIAGMRDKLIHEYSGIKLGRVWNVIEKDLPVLKKNLDSLMKKIK